MQHFKNLPELGRHMVFLARRRKHVINPKFRSGLLSWLLEKDGWITPVWTHVRNYSDHVDVVRFSTKISTRLPKNQWPYKQPDIFGFEMTAMLSECSDSLLDVVFDYCELARRQPEAGFDRHPPEFPAGSSHGGYGWTKLASDTVFARSRKS